MGRMGGITTQSLVLLLLVLSGHQWTSCALAQSIIDHSDQNKITAATDTEGFVIAGNSTLHYVDSGSGDRKSVV